ncbi:MAG: AlkZ family DNA glycosylase [Devosia nanyangense]|uniref:AlkZ family DNA glycosylase n=1 Tax=Devosia nanyangense TaxID=1228055 RepID=A0A933L3T4_9HYPH|nr:AlkZ family DNA glycosylase [Devosia nanyangense]
MTREILTIRALNRATLARQMLLERSDTGLVEAAQFLIGLQGQVSEGPYQGLWSRLRGFRHEDLTALIVDRTLVRATSLRATLHLHTVDDLLGLRPLVQPVLERMWQSAFGKRRFGDNDVRKVHRAGVKLLDRGPMTGNALGKALQEQFPDGEALAKSVLLQVKEVLVQIPPTRIWGSGHAPIQTRAENWVSPPFERTLRREDLTLRYLGAYGPASIADMQAWSGMTRLAEDFAPLAGRLVAFEGEDGRVLHDLPDAPRPDEATIAPVRFLPDFDNVILGYADRTRILSDERAARLVATRSFRSVLVDGFVAATWSIAAAKGRARLTVTPFRTLLKREIRDIEREGRAFLQFMQPDMTCDIVMAEV